MLDVFGLFKVDTLYVVIGLLVITIAANSSCNCCNMQCLCYDEKV